MKSRSCWRLLFVCPSRFFLGPRTTDSKIELVVLGPRKAGPMYLVVNYKGVIEVESLEKAIGIALALKGDIVRYIYPVSGAASG